MKRAVVVGDGRMHVEAALGALTSAGFEAVSVATTGDARAAIEAGAVAVVAGAGSGWDAESARPFGVMPAGLRRGCLVVVVGEALQTGDGLRAFLYGVDLVVAGSDLPRLGELTAGALAAKRALVGPLDPAAASRLAG